MEIRLLTLGTVRCFVGDIELTDLPAQRLRCAALLYLAVERETTREAAASLLWPERTSERARHAFSQKVYELRQVLGEEWLETHGDRMRVTPTLRVDARDFEDCVARGDATSALALYNGDFLKDFYLPESKEFETWVDRHHARLGRLHRKLRREFIDQLVHAGDLPRAITEARRWVELEPLEDEAQHRLIELFADTGQRAEAIRQYESYEIALRAQDLEALDDTRVLMERVRQSNAVPTLPPGAAPPQAPEVKPAGAPVLSPTKVAVPPRGRQISRVAWVALAALALVGGGWWTARHYIPTYNTPARSIAVLPFLNLSAQPDASEHLSDGIAEELINALSQIDSLNVAARTSSFRFKNRDASIRDIGDSLRVALVVEGSVRQEGSRLRVTAQLINVSDGYHVWSNTFNGDVKDVLSVQEEIAKAIVAALRIRLADPERARLALGTSNARAYESFLRGRYLLQKGTRTSIPNALEYLDSATVQDPHYANAYAELAQAYVLAATTRVVPRAEGLQTARAAAERAIGLAPNLSESRAALGRVDLELWNWDAAEKETTQAIELDRKNSSAHAIYSRILMVRGRMDEAVREAALAAQLEPLSAAAADNYAEALRAARKYSEAVQIHRKALELEPDLGRQNLAKAYIELGRYDSALAQFEAAANAGAPRFPMIQLLWTAYTYARSGKHEKALTLLRQFEGRQPEGPNAYMIASLYTAVGNHERAFQLLEAGLINRAAAWRQLPWDPVWDPVRSDPRFRRILQQMNLEP